MPGITHVLAPPPDPLLSSSIFPFVTSHVDIVICISKHHTDIVRPMPNYQLVLSWFKSATFITSNSYAITCYKTKIESTQEFENVVIEVFRRSPYDIMLNSFQKSKIPSLCDLMFCCHCKDFEKTFEELLLFQIWLLLSLKEFVFGLWGNKRD